MITEFSVDKAFFESPLLHDQSLSLVHDFITRSWIETGALVIPKGSRDTLLELIKGLPEKFQQRWFNAIEYGIKREVEREWWSFGNYETFEEVCRLNDLFKTAFAEESVAYVFSESEDLKRACGTTGFEVLSAGVCSESENLRKSVDLAKADITHPQTANDVWIQRLKPLAKYSKKILIVDRYFFANVQDAVIKQKNDDSMKNFFVFLADLGTQHHIKIISHGDVKNSPLHAAVHGRFFNQIALVPALKKAVSSLTLISAQEEFFRDDAHDRFIGFDKHICQIGNGMRVLGSSPLPRSTFAAKFDYAGELSSRESRSRQFTLWKEEII